MNYGYRAAMATVVVVALLIVSYLLFPQFHLANQSLKAISLERTTPVVSKEVISAQTIASWGAHYDNNAVHNDNVAIELMQPSPFANEPYIEPLCGALAQEAESGLLSGFFTIGSDDQASGGRFVHVAQGWGQRFDGLDELHKVSYCIDVPAAGSYQILATAHAHGASNDSMYLQIDGAPTGGYIWHVAQNATYEESYVTDAILGEPITLNLSAGRHTLAFFLREDDTRLDKFELVPLVAAASLSPTQSNRLNENATGILGNISTDIGYAWLPKLATPQIADLRVNIVDADTNGERYQYRTFTNDAGEYRIAGLVPGSYNIELDIPYGHQSIGPESIVIPVYENQLSVASFDLLLIDDLSAFAPVEEPTLVAPYTDEVQADNNISQGDAKVDDTVTPHIYVPIVQR